MTEVLTLLQKSKLNKAGYSKKKDNNSLNVKIKYNIENVAIIIRAHYRSIPKNGV